MPEFTTFIGPTYRQYYTGFVAPEVCMNQYVEMSESPGGRSIAWLTGTPGFTLYADPGLFPGRGVFYEAGRFFCVAGAGLFEVDLSTGIITGRGALADDGLPVTIHSNGVFGHQLFIVAATKGYIFDLNTNILTNPVNNCIRGDYLGGYFIALDSVTHALKISALNDGSTWSSSTANRSLAGDPWVSFIVAHSEIWLIGEKTGEVWTNTGAFPFPFEPIPGAFFEFGILAPWSLRVVNNAVTWLGNAKGGGSYVLQEAGYVPRRISTGAIQNLIKNKTNAAGTAYDAEAFSYSVDGHDFYQLTFPTANFTIDWDAATGLWHERGTYNNTTMDFDAQRIRTVTSFYPVGSAQTRNVQHMAIDRVGGGLYIMDESVSTDVSGVGIRRVRRSPHILHEGELIDVDCFALDITVGSPTQPVVQPAQIMMRFSYDGGGTWSNIRQKSLGNTAQWKTRVRWEQLGAVRDRLFEVVIADLYAPYRIAHAWLNPPA